MKKLILLSYLFLSLSLFGNIDGIYQLTVLDAGGDELSVATGFAVNHNGKHIISSYHLLDTYILEANKIVMNYKGQDIELKIENFDDLHDVLILKPVYDIIDDDDFIKLSKKCTKDVEVIGFRKGKQYLISTEFSGKTRLAGFERLDTFLPQGFSGSPVLTEDGSKACAMVILSNKEDANSIAVRAFSFYKILQNTYNMTIAEHRMAIGLEYTVRNNKELNRITRLNKNRQIIVNVIGNDVYTIRNTKNIILNILKHKIKGLRVLNSRNIFINGMSGSKLFVKNSELVTVANSVFSDRKYGIFLVNSSNLLISNNKFVSLSNGIVLKNMSTSAINTIFVKQNIYKKVGKKVLVIS